MPKIASVVICPLPIENNEWDSLPSTVKRKYFSSLERLRLAQDAASTAKSVPGSRRRTDSMKISKLAKKPSRPKLGRRSSSSLRNPSILRSKKTASPTSDTFSPEDAQWFLRLPDKIRRKQFTREERLLLSGQPEIVIPDAADERLYRNFFQLTQEANRSVPTLRTSSYSSLSTLNTFESDQPVDAEAEEMDDSVFDGFRWIENDEDLDLASTLDDYHAYMSSAAESNVKTSKHHPSFRRALSLTSLPFGTKTTALPAKASNTTPPTPLPTTPSQTTHQRNVSRPQLHPAIPNHASVSAPDPSAAHYQDEQARLKLRIYLASPQKFDEAIEFGFPSMDETPARPVSRPSLSTRHHHTAPLFTFLHESSPSLFSPFSISPPHSDVASLPDRNSPRTRPITHDENETYLLSPSTISSGHPSKPISSHHNASDLLPKPTIRHNTTDPYAQVLAGSREMTLRMTLTRPDLRADEKAFLAHTAGDDPLALEHLPPTSGTGSPGNKDFWDQLPREKGVLKRVWGRVRGRGD